MEERLAQLEKALDDERSVVAELRSSYLVLQQSVDRQWGEIGELKEIAQSLLQTVQVQQRNIELLAEAMQRQRKEGHGE